MKKLKIFFSVSLVFMVYFLVCQVQAWIVTDVYQNDLNIITSASQDNSKAEYLITEDYNEFHLIPYPSHDGYAIVNRDKNFFDKVFTFDNDDLNNNSIWLLDFRVHNTSPYVWSDYHFEFWNADFTQRYQTFPLLDWSSSIFMNSYFNGSVLEFWAPDSQGPCETNQFLLKINIGSITCPTSFGIRQVATTIPEPSCFLLLGIGLVGIAFLGRRYKR